MDIESFEKRVVMEALLPFQTADLKAQTAAECQDAVPLGIRSNELKFLVLLSSVRCSSLVGFGREQHMGTFGCGFTPCPEQRVSVFGPGPIHVELVDGPQLADIRQARNRGLHTIKLFIFHMCLQFDFVAHSALLNTSRGISCSLCFWDRQAASLRRAGPPS